MKKYALFVAAALLCLNVGCKKDDPAPVNPTPTDPTDTTTPPEEIVDGITADGALFSLFSVDEGRQVQFSRGNLQYKAATDKWRFATTQYACIGTSNANASAEYNGWIDLFGWATSGFDCGNQFYHPYDMESVGDFSIFCGYGPIGSYSLTDDYANCDWGVYNIISNGGNKAGMWRTLTAEEWTYLLNDRPNAAQKYGLACVEGNNGLVILPDSWTLPAGLTFKPGLSSADDMTEYSKRNSYDEDEWIQMQKAGALFLPAGGFRNTDHDNTIEYVGDMGHYWSVTPVSEPALYDHCAHDLSFYSNYLRPNDIYKPRYYGCSVRLVKR